MFQPFSPALRDCLSQLAEAARRIGQSAGNLTETAFLNNCLVQDAVGRNLKIISESAQMIEEHCPDFRATHGENLCMPVDKLRGVFSFGYLQVDARSSWRAVKEVVPEIGEQVVQLQIGFAGT